MCQRKDKCMQWLDVNHFGEISEYLFYHVAVNLLFKLQSSGYRLGCFQIVDCHMKCYCSDD